MGAMIGYRVAALFLWVVDVGFALSGWEWTGFVFGLASIVVAAIGTWKQIVEEV